MSKISLDQKRLEKIRRQLYGKEVTSLKDQELIQKRADSLIDHSAPKPSFSLTGLTGSGFSDNQTVNSTITSNYLKNDLLKILILSTLAMAAQICLYFAIKLNYLNLPL